jgi:hypothetical protein
MTSVGADMEMATSCASVAASGRRYLRGESGAPNEDQHKRNIILRNRNMQVEQDNSERERERKRGRERERENTRARFTQIRLRVREVGPAVFFFARYNFDVILAAEGNIGQRLAVKDPVVLCGTFET